MVKKIWAILDHYSSTADQPKHEKCPKRENSLYPHQRDISTSQKTYKPAKWPLLKAIVDVITPVIYSANKWFPEQVQTRVYSTFKRVIQFISLEPFSERAIQLTIRNTAFHQSGSLFI